MLRNQPTKGAVPLQEPVLIPSVVSAGKVELLCCGVDFKEKQNIFDL